MTGDGFVTVLVFAATVPAVAFPLVYLRSPWRSTLPGRSTMALAVVIAIVLVLACLRRTLGLPPVPFQIVAYGLTLVVLWAQLIVLLKVQANDRRTDPTHRPN